MDVSRGSALNRNFGTNPRLIGNDTDETMRRNWIDNLRWVTVLLVLLYHVVYFFNNKGVFGGIGGFGEYPQTLQYQDVLMYVLYP